MCRGERGGGIGLRGGGKGKKTTTMERVCHELWLLHDCVTLRNKLTCKNTFFPLLF